MRFLILFHLSFFLGLVPNKISYGDTNPPAPPTTVNLESWTSTEPFSLDRAWYVFPNEFIGPKQIQARMASSTPFQTTPVSKSLQDLGISQPKDTNYGFATYALQVRNVPTNQKLAITSPTIFSAGKVFWISLKNGSKPVLLMQRGIPSSSPAKEITGTGPQEVFPIPQESDGIILIQLSNHFHTWGGLWTAPKIGIQEQLEAVERSRLNANYLSMGILIFIAFFNISLYLKRREDIGSLMLGFGALAFALRSFNYIGGFLPYLPEDWQLGIFLKIIYATMILNPTIAINFLNTYFPQQFRSTHKKFLNLTMLPLALVVLFSPNEIYWRLSYPLLFLSGCMLLYLTVSAIRAAIAKEVGSVACLT